MPQGYFTEKSTEFFKNLALNNNKIWFNEHRKEYETYLKKPIKEFAEDLTLPMMEIDPDFIVQISRINKDIRFSKDKKPYKTALWITFKRNVKDWQDYPAYFFEIASDFYRYGMGFYMASPKTMENFRKKIDENQSKFLKIFSPLDSQKVFSKEGDDYKRLFKQGLSPELQYWYQKKNFYFITEKPAGKMLYSHSLIEEIIRDFYLLKDVYQFLIQVKNHR